MKCFSLLIAMSLFFCSSASAKPKLGLDYISGKPLPIHKNDVVTINTKQTVHKGDIVQRNALSITVMASDAKPFVDQCTSLKQCVGKIATKNLSSGQTLATTFFEEAPNKAKKSKVLKTTTAIQTGEFIAPGQINVVEVSIAPDKVPVNWLSCPDDVIGRKAKAAIPANTIVTEAFFGPRGTLLHPEEIKEF